MTGDHTVGSTLSASIQYADADGISTASPVVFWYADNDLLDHTGIDYTITSSDLGKTISFQVAFYDDLNNLEYSVKYSIPNTVVTSNSDTTAPAIPTINTVMGDNIVTIDEINGILLTGNAEANSTVKVWLPTL